MSYNLFVDDVREVQEAFFRKHKSFSLCDWVVVRSVKEALAYIKIHGMPKYISFDYDLEEGYTIDLIHYLIANKKTIPTEFDYDIHSTNRHGVNLIKDLMRELSPNTTWDY